MQAVVRVPAIRGRMGGRTYFTVSMRLKTVPRFFEFQNYKALEPEERAQRVLNKLRIPAIRDYLLENPDGYVFSSITASYQLPEGIREEELFSPFEDGSDIGILNLPMEADLLINDGQHRRAAIAAALEEDPAIGEELDLCGPLPLRESRPRPADVQRPQPNGPADDQEPEHPL